MKKRVVSRLFLAIDGQVSLAFFLKEEHPHRMELRGSTVLIKNGPAHETGN